jgi:hypothetical protein
MIAHPSLEVFLATRELFVFVRGSSVIHTWLCHIRNDLTILIEVLSRTSRPPHLSPLPLKGERGIKLAFTPIGGGRENGQTTPLSPLAPVSGERAGVRGKKMGAFN